jgi:hypothetical protein
MEAMTSGQVKMGRRSWAPRWLWLAVGAIIGASAVAIAVWATRPAQVTLWMTPVHPLTLAVCAEEAHQFGYSIGAGRIICEPGVGGTWYSAILVNDGQYARVSCTATGYGARGAVIFSGLLPFELGGIRGLFAPAHQALSFTWYLPQRPNARVRTYVATCSTLPYP